jgi:hypothetical protein
MRASLIALGIAFAAAAAPADTYLVQSGQDSSPYAFLPGLSRGFHSSAYAFTMDDDGTDHSFEYYVRWNLPPQLLEPGVQVEQALAWVYYGFDYVLFGDFSNEVGELLCHEVLASWSESSLTWNNRPPIDNYFDANFDILNRGLYWCDVTDLVKQWIADPSTNHGIALTSSRQRVMGFYTFDDGTVSPNFKPSLMVKTVPEPAAAASLAAGCLLLVKLERRRARRRDTNRPLRPRRTR